MSTPSPDAESVPSPESASVGETDAASPEAAEPAPAAEAPAGEVPADESPAEPALAAEAPAEPGPAARALDVADPSRMRRAPRYGRFAFVGFLLGAILAAVLTQFPQDQSPLAQYAPRDVFLILLIALGAVGTLAGLTWALVSDRRSLRRRG